MRRDIKEYIRSCKICIQDRGIRNYPLNNTQLPEKPWTIVGSDLFEFRGKDYLIVVNYYSGWIEVAEMCNKTAETTIKKMKNMFSRYGVSQVIRIDNGPYYASKKVA